MPHQIDFIWEFLSSSPKTFHLKNPHCSPKLWAEWESEVFMSAGRTHWSFGVTLYLIPLFFLLETWGLGSLTYTFLWNSGVHINSKSFFMDITYFNWFVLYREKEINSEVPRTWINRSGIGTCIFPNVSNTSITMEISTIQFKITVKENIIWIGLCLN